MEQDKKSQSYQPRSNYSPSHPPASLRGFGRGIRDNDKSVLVNLLVLVHLSLVLPRCLLLLLLALTCSCARAPAQRVLCEEEGEE